MFIENKDGDIILKIKVIPNSPKNCIKGFVGDRLKVKINALPEDNKANNELVNYLAELFGVKKSNIKIINGLKSREKTISIKEVKQEQLIQKLKEAGI